MRIVVFGDFPGVAQLLRHLPACHVAGLVGAAIRPQYLGDLHALATRMTVPFLVQPQWGSTDYPRFRSAVAALIPDLIWVNSYSMIVREDVLSLPRIGGINVHGALLPRNRGCNPVQWAIINGDVETGVTLHELTPGIDEGPIIDQRRVPLFFADTSQTLAERMARAADDLIAANLPKILAGRWTAEKQDERAANYCRRRTPDDGLFDWRQPVISIYNRIRALLPPLPPAFYLDGNGQRISMDRHLTPAEVAALKYGTLGKCVLESDTVRLRPLSHADSALAGEPFTRRQSAVRTTPLCHPPQMSPGVSTESTRPGCADLLLFVIEELPGNTAAGTCQLLNIDWQNRNAELRVRVHSDRFAPDGTLAETLTLLSHFGFEDLKLRRVFVHACENDGSIIRACEKTGFVREGSFEEAAVANGTSLNVVVLGLVGDHR